MREAARYRPRGRQIRLGNRGIDHSHRERAPRRGGVRRRLTYRILQGLMRCTLMIRAI